MHLPIELKFTIVFGTIYLMLSCAADAGYGNYGSYGYYPSAGGGGSGGGGNGHHHHGSPTHAQGHGYTDRTIYPEIYPSYYYPSYNSYYRPPYKKSFKKTALGILAGLTGGLLLLGGLMPTLALGGMAAGGLGGLGGLGGGGFGGLGSLGLGGGGAFGGLTTGASSVASGALGGIPPIGKRSLNDDDTKNDKELYDRTLKNLKMQLASVRSPGDCRRMLKMCDLELKRWMDQSLQMVDGPTVFHSVSQNDKSLPKTKTIFGGPKGDYASQKLKVRRLDDEAQQWCHRVLPQCVLATASTPTPKGILHKT